MSEKITANLEQTLKQSLFETIGARAIYPGYPSIRLDITHPLVADQVEQGKITHLPEGPWNTGTPKLQVYPDENKINQWLQDGYSLDAQRRPLHPWLIDMLQDINVGVVTGTGAYWNMGPNKTADPIIIAEELDNSYLFLIQRSDNGLWALPGGFIDQDEDAATAACREAFEEGGIIIDSPSYQLYSGVVADMRTTAYAWAETTALVFKTLNRQTPVIDPNEVLAAKWFALNSLPQDFHGSHKALVEEALRYENL